MYKYFLNNELAFPSFQRNDFFVFVSVIFVNVHSHTSFGKK